MFRAISWAFLGVILSASQAHAINYGTGLENTEWILDGTIYGCKMSQPIPYYGFATFFKEAGEDVIFYLETTHNDMKPGQAALVIEAPDWQSSAITTDLGFAEVKDYKYPVRIESKRTRHMMAELDLGMAPTLTRRAKHDAHQVRVRVSPVSYRQFLPEYLACVSGLLPVNFRQVEQVAILFEVGQEGLNSSNVAQLERIATYVKNDPKVFGIYIDGHTDDIGTRYHNRRLSEKRAEMSTDRLIRLGVDPDMIITRYHGERYPIASNDTVAGRAQNRRVTIRLERSFGDSDDPLADHPVFE